MSIIFAAITPHPPIMVPESGGTDSTKVQKSIAAMEKFSQDLDKTDPETIILISPHGLVYPDRMNICGMPKLKGDFSQFGHPEIKFKFENDLQLVKEINAKADAEGIETLLYTNDNPDNTFELDHGSLVPLYFICKHLTNVKVVPIAYSYLNVNSHFAFGEALADVLEKLKNKRVAIIASVDLSHRLLPQSPAGYSTLGKKFDQQLIKALEKNEVTKILNFDEEFIDEAGECGYRSILILLGAISHLKYQVKKLSYECPFGVGYAVVEFKIK